jgi:hypothetical protein
MIKFKAFIYRFSAIFGLRIYLAQKEELAYRKSMEAYSEFDRDINAGLWQGKHGFTTVWTYKQPFFKALVSKIKHAFKFRSYE